MSGERELLHRTAEIAAAFLETLDDRSVWPPASIESLRAALGGPLPAAGTTWDGRRAIRLSVSNWRTSDADIDRSAAAFERALVAVAV